ncbi:hypothetical protein CYY_001899 [Polysphondylium violaceum]|uniref:Uncharacterized protein n=1 Tax=Polysphondylium violaceum TaxID=133409 RepID=A0A8J4PXJ9_9MYCE|nr:hypothetical protein CYY_001899 [Polysphondylium violaceum]
MRLETTGYAPGAIHMTLQEYTMDLHKKANPPSSDDKELTTAALATAVISDPMDDTPEINEGEQEQVEEQELEKEQEQEE